MNTVDADLADALYKKASSPNASPEDIAAIVKDSKEKQVNDAIQMLLAKHPYDMHTLFMIAQSTSFKRPQRFVAKKILDFPNRYPELVQKAREILNERDAK